MLTGCASLPPQAMHQIRTAHDQYRAYQYTRAEQLLDPVIAEHGDKPEIAEALYLRGLCRLQTRQRAKARRDLQTALDRSKRDDLTALLHAQLGNLDFEDGRYERAARHYRSAELRLPDGPPTDHVLYQYGLSLLRCGEFTEGRLVLAEVFVRYPRSEHASPARRAYKWDRDYFTVQCGAFSTVATAHETAARLRQKGFEALAVPETRGASRLYLVHVGKHQTYASATDALDGVRSVVPDAFVVP